MRIAALALCVLPLAACASSPAPAPASSSSVSIGSPTKLSRLQSAAADCGQLAALAKGGDAARVEGDAAVSCMLGKLGAPAAVVGKVTGAKAGATATPVSWEKFTGNAVRRADGTAVLSVSEAR